MNQPVKFKRIQEIAHELSVQLEKLQMGQLSTAELEALTEHSRELHERLIVLRYKAYDGEVKPTAPKAPVHEAPAQVSTSIEEPKPIAFKINEPKAEAVPNQVSLIDAIEEVVKQEPSIPPVIENIPFQINNSASINDAAKGDLKESLNDRFNKSMGAHESLAQKLENTPIPDLKKAISLNQRFQFSKELFKGNNQDYELTIDRLNNTSREEALKTLESLRSKYAWNNESRVAQDFVDLVERRFL